MVIPECGTATVPAGQMEKLKLREVSMLVSQTGEG